MCKIHNPRKIDRCMEKAIRTLQIVFRHINFEILACCCGHGKYPMTIVYRMPVYRHKYWELFSSRIIGRKKRFYIKDKQGYYYIPETILPNKVETVLSFVLRAKNRIKVLRLLTKERLIPSQIMKKTNMYESHTSRTLKELLSKKLIVCENPDDRRFRFYKITQIGDKMVNEVDRIKDESKNII